MSPETANKIVQAMRNERRPQRTLHARVRDALLHVEASEKEKPASRDVTDGLNNSLRDLDYGTKETEQP